MATAFHSPMAIPGLHRTPTSADFDISRTAYNALPEDGTQPEVTESTLKELEALLLAYNVQEKFGYHLIHGHLTVEEGKVMYGKPMTRLQGYLTCPTSVAELDFSELHGHIFALGPDGRFRAYEFREGPPPNMTDGDSAFVAAMQDHLLEKGLDNLIGFEVLNNADKGKNMQEFVLSGDRWQGTAMLDAKATNVTTSNDRVTGWAICEVPGAIPQLGKTQVHHRSDDGRTHVHVNPSSNPNKEIATIEGLRQEGLIN